MILTSNTGAQREKFQATESKTGKVKTNKSILAAKNCYKNHQEKGKTTQKLTNKADI